MKMLAELSKEKIQQLVLTGILSLLALTLTMYFYVGSAWTALRESNEKIAKLRHKIEAAEKEAAQEAANAALRAQTEEFVRQRQQELVSGDPFIWVVREVMLLAEHHPVRILAQRPGQRIPRDRRSRMDIYQTRVELAAGYDQLGVFLRDFENHFSTAEIRLLEIAGGDAAAGELRVGMEVAFRMQPELESNRPEAAPPEKKES